MKPIAFAGIVYLFLAAIVFISGELNASELSKLRIDLGLDIKSSSQKRGITLYRFPTFEPSIHFHLEDEHRQDATKSASSLHLSLGTASVGVSFLKYLRFDTGLNFFSGEELIRMFGDDLRHHRSRPLSLEFFSRLGLESAEWFDVGIEIDRNFRKPYGLRAELSTAICVLMNIWVRGSLGIADRAHNLYLYGAGASAGLSHYSGGVHLEWPNLFWGISLGTGADYSGLIGDNRRASHVKGRPDSLQGVLSFRRSL